MKRFGKNYQYLNQYPYPYTINPPKKMNIIIDEEPFVQSYDSILVQKLKQSNQENFNDNCKSKKFLRLSELAESNLYNIMDIRENCTAEEVKRAYKKMAVKEVMHICSIKYKRLIRYYHTLLLRRSMILLVQEVLS